MERGKVSAESVEQSKASSSAPPPPPLPPWIELPPEITADILQRLGVVEILEIAQKVCTTWWKISKDPGIWKTIDMSCGEDDKYTYFQKEMMCRQAVERSQGQVIDIQITNLSAESTDLIRFIGERCSQLTCLSLHFFCPNSTTIDCVNEAVKKLVLLEKLQVEVVRALFTRCCELIETAGKSCPALKSFTFKKIRLGMPLEVRDGCVLGVVASCMPELRHLGLQEDSVTTDGLEAVLDGCIHLESLHLRRCSKLRIEGELARRCSQQIRDLRIEEDLLEDSDSDLRNDDSPRSFGDDIYDPDWPSESSDDEHDYNRWHRHDYNRWEHQHDYNRWHEHDY